MKIAVIDHFSLDREHLAAEIEQYMEQNGIQGSVLTCLNGEEFLDTYKLQEFPAVFLDIYLNGMDGLEVAHRIRLENSDCRIVFVTASAAHALEGYKVQAFRYLLKPLDEEALWEALSGIFSSLLSEADYIEVKQERIQRKIPVSRIRMAELQGHYTIFDLADGEEVKARLTIRELLESLRDERFVECYRNVLVNMDYVEALAEEGGTESFCLQGGKKIPIQRTRKKQVRQQFADYQFNKEKRG